MTCGMGHSQYCYSTAKGSGDAGQDRGIQSADMFQSGVGIQVNNIIQCKPKNNLWYGPQSVLLLHC